MPKVSVLLTTYNRPDMLEEAIKSVLDQTMQDFELILLDDNSDQTDQLALLYEYWDHPKVRLYKDDVSNNNRRDKTRYAVLANIGISIARGKYITYLCDDDLYLPRRLELMTARLDRGDCHVVFGTQRVMSAQGSIVYYRMADRIRKDAHHIVDHSSVMHTREAAMAVGGWDDDPTIWRDADAFFWDRLTNMGYYFHPVKEECDVHRFHPNSVSERGGF
jgi:spore maturation protein CgeD